MRRLTLKRETIRRLANQATIRAGVVGAPVQAKTCYTLARMCDIAKEMTVCE